MMALTLISTGNSDSAWCNLVFTRQDDGEISPCLTGEIKGQKVQIDFDDLNDADLEDFICYLQRRKAVKALPHNDAAEKGGDDEKASF